MLAGESSRKREFSEIRSVYKSEKSLSPYSRNLSHTYSQFASVHDPVSHSRKHKERPIQQSRSITPVKQRQHLQQTAVKTPTKTSRQVNFTTASPIHLVSHNSKGNQQILNKSRQCLKPTQYCLGCTNQYLTETKKKIEQERQNKQQKYYKTLTKIHNEQVLRSYQQQEAIKNYRYKTLLDDNLEQIAEKQQRKRKERLAEVENERKKYADGQEAERVKLQNQRARSYKEQAFRKDILKQIEEDKSRKKEVRAKQKGWEPAVADYSSEIKEISRNNIRQREYRLELLDQIEQKQERQRKAQQKERQLDEINLKSTRQEFISKYEREVKRNRDYQRHLQDQIINKQMNKKRAKEQEEREFNQMHNTLMRQVQEEALMSRAIGAKKMNRYMSDLKGQIVDQRARKLKEKEFERVPAFAPLMEIAKQRLEECDKCHKEYPLKYMSIIEPA